MVAALGFGGKLGALGAVLHMLFHGVAKPLMFFCAGNVQQHYGTPYLRKVTGAMRTLPISGGLFLLATFAVTGVPPFGLFQSELMTLSAGLAGDHIWPAGLIVAGIVMIFAGFLAHMSRLTLGLPAHGEARGAECPWKLSAVLLVAVPVVLLGLVLPAPLYELVHRAAVMIEGGP
jgi:hydrogenase-4 component F